MRKFIKAFTIVFTLLLLAFIPKANANINAIDFKKVNYPENLQSQITFLVDNVNIYNHWVHDWTAAISKKDVEKNLTSLYTGLDKLPNKNIETHLLLGDIAHYLYNMELESYYKKAVDNYLAAKAVDAKDYRVYWFLGNHYSLSATAVLSINTYKMAMPYLPAPNPNPLFWADYAIACANASMQGTARYAAHQASLVAGQKLSIEDDINGVTMAMTKSPPADTVLTNQDIWSPSDKNGEHIIFNNRTLGTQLSVNPNWGIDLGGLKNRTSYAMLSPQAAISKKGKKIGYSMLVMTKVASNGQSLKEYLDLVTGNAEYKKTITMDVGAIKNCLAYEIKDPGLYKENGGGHCYAIAIERDNPEYPGLAIELPIDLPKQGNKNIVYYTSTQKYSRIKGRIYYLIMLDTCEDIFGESFSVFKDFLDKRIIIE